MSNVSSGNTFMGLDGVKLYMNNENGSIIALSTDENKLSNEFKLKIESGVLSELVQYSLDGC